jgi:hypothetical protein
MSFFFSPLLAPYTLLPEPRPLHSVTADTDQITYFAPLYRAIIRGKMYLCRSSAVSSGLSFGCSRIYVSFYLSRRFLRDYRPLHDTGRI